MKKIVAIAFFVVMSMAMYAQTDGISYQAVIIDPNGQEIPGVDAEGNILPHATVSIRFTIIDENNTEIYQEVQTTNTDQYGMINLLIGQGDIEEFTKIDWNGTFMDLKVEIDFTGTGGAFVDMSRQDLLFLPYAYHRNITAAGTLIVDDATTLNSSLTVDGPTALNSSLDVNNNNTSSLTGPLNVDGATDLNSSLTVDGMANLNDSLNVNLQSPTYLSGKITVEDTATFNGPALFNAPVEFVEITVNGPSYLNGQVKIDKTLADDGADYNNYPLLVEGSQQGIAIKVSGSRSNDNNYISFWDEDTNQMWGRIEGETTGNLLTNPDYIYETASQAVDLGIATAEVVVANADAIISGFELGMSLVDVGSKIAGVAAASSSATGCVGLGACVTVPIPSLIADAVKELVISIANAVIVGANFVSVVANALIVDGSLVKVVADIAAYQTFLHTQIGVTYQSGAGDYAEWLPKADPNEVFYPGDIVGVTNGFISKSTSGAQQVMVVSTRPIVLGNMPPENEESNYEKIAFMGQVPAKVIGKVKAGDYILPNIIGSGFGVAVHPDDMLITDYKKIVGIAWSASGENTLSMINVAVGMNTNDMNSVVLNQDDKIKTVETELAMMQQQIDQLTSALIKLVPGFKEVNNDNLKLTASQTSIVSDDMISDESYKADMQIDAEIDQNNDASYFSSTAEEVIYFDIPREYIEEGIKMAREVYLSTSGKSLDEHPFWKKMKDEPAYVDEVILDVKSKLKKSFKDQVAANKRLENLRLSTIK